MNGATEYRRIALIMVVGFGATIAYQYWRDLRFAPPVIAAAEPLMDAVPPQATPPPAASPMTPQIPARTATAPMPRQPAVAPERPADEPPSAAPALPEIELLFNGLPDGKSRVRVLSRGDAPLAGSVRVMRAGRLVGERRVHVPPYKQLSLGGEDGLDLQSGDQIEVRSDAGTVMTEAVP